MILLDPNEPSAPKSDCWRLGGDAQVARDAFQGVDASTGQGEADIRISGPVLRTFFRLLENTATVRVGGQLCCTGYEVMQWSETRGVVLP